MLLLQGPLQRIREERRVDGHLRRRHPHPRLVGLGEVKPVFSPSQEMSLNVDNYYIVGKADRC